MYPAVGGMRDASVGDCKRKTRLANRAVCRDEERNCIGCAIRGARCNLRIRADVGVFGGRRAGAACRRLCVATAATVRIERRPQAIRNGIDLLQPRLPIREELQLSAGKRGKRCSGVHRAGANSGIPCALGYAGSRTGFSVLRAKQR